jgi:hypothetical protein
MGPGMKLSAAAGTAQFWRVYAFDEADGFDIDEQGEDLAEKIGEPKLDIPFRMGWFLRLYLCFDPSVHTLMLASLDAKEAEDLAEYDSEEIYDPDEDEDEWPDLSESRLELGHWDMARWHPFCLRWEEVEAVVRHMRQTPESQHISPELAMLLLARWVGHGSDEGDLLTARRQIIATELERVGPFRGEAAARMADLLMPRVSEDDYAWQWHETNGWTFGGSYACYSNRNDGHDFPFAEFAEFRRLIGVADQPGNGAHPGR